MPHNPALSLPEENNIQRSTFAVPKAKMDSPNKNKAIYHLPVKTLPERQESELQRPPRSYFYHQAVLGIWPS